MGNKSIRQLADLTEYHFYAILLTVTIYKEISFLKQFYCNGHSLVVHCILLWIIRSSTKLLPRK